MGIRPFLLTALLFSTGTACFADEDFCGYIASGELKFRYIGTGERSTSLEISVPLRDGKAKLHRLDVAIGEGNDSVSFTLETEKSKGRATGDVHLSRPHKPVHVEAIYHQGRCFKLLKATFVNEKRVAEPAASN